MDISKVRKKLKELKADEEKKPSVEEKEIGNVGTPVKEEDTRETAPDSQVVPGEETGSPEAVVPEEETVHVEEIEIIAFHVANEEFAVRLSDMKEILRYQVITAVPRAPKFFQGVTFLRGTVMPVINLKERLALTGGNGERQKIMVLFTSKEPVGILVNKVNDVIRVPETDILAPPSTLTARERSFLEGVIIKGERFISVLKVQEIVRIDI